MKAERVIDGPLGPAVELPPVRLTKAAADRVAIACCRGHAHVELGRTFTDAEWEKAWACQKVLEERRQAWRAGSVAAVEAAVAELRLAGWKVIPPGGPPGGSALKGGV